MKTIKTYECECGEDFYEDDTACLNCQRPIEKDKLKEIRVAEVINEIQSKNLTKAREIYKKMKSKQI